MGVQPGQIEQVLDQSLESPGLSTDDLGGVDGVIGGAVDDCIGVPSDRREGSAEFVGDGEEN